MLIVNKKFQNLCTDTLIKYLSVYADVSLKKMKNYLMMISKSKIAKANPLE